MNPRMPGLELWFVTGSQHLYGPEVLDLVNEHARAIASGLDGQAAIPVCVVPKPVVSTAEGIAGAAARGGRQPGLRRGHRVDAHVLARQDVDRRAQRAPHAARPPPHAVQPRPAVVVDRHGLHEPEPVGARRPRVRVHPDAPAPQPQDGGRALAGSRGRRPARLVGARGGRLVRGSPASDRAVRRQHARRRRHGGRQGRGTGPARVLGQRLRGERPRRGGRGRLRDRHRPASSTPTRRPTTSRRSSARRAGDTATCARRRGSRRACGPSSRPAGSARSPTRSRTSARSSSCRASAPSA